MKTLAFTVCHYGSEYLQYAIESVKDHVDNHLIVYTEKPSFGHTTTLANPDTRDDIKAIADQYDHIIWHDVVNVFQENQHRQKGLNYAKKNGFDIMLVVDYDEIWDSSRVQEAIDYAYQSNNGHFCVKGSQWVTLWKSFNEYVTDGFAPVRLFNVNNNINDSEHIDKGFIYHMGYCISDELMRYKISCHGHKDDFTRNNKWFENKWVNYRSGVTRFLHPATDAYWQDAQPFDKTKLPELLKIHPNYKKN
jgi:hypothetical protein